MKVSQIMTKTAHTILPDATVEQAAQRMRDANVGLLPVVEESKVIGIVTDRDLAVRAIAQGRNPHLTTVRDVMTQEALWCYEDDAVTEASHVMEKNHIRRLVVMTRRHQFAGVLTLTDLALKFTNEKLSGHVLHKVAETE